MKKAFTLVELLLVVGLLSLLMAAIIVNTNNISEKTKYNEAKEQLKSYLTYNKYKALNEQTNVVLIINNENNDIVSPFDTELAWLEEFTNELKIVDSSSTNLIFNIDGSNEEAYIDVISNNGAYSNRLTINPFGSIKFIEIPSGVTNEYFSDDISDDNN